MSPPPGAIVGMNALDKRFEGPGKRSRPQAVVNLQGLRPAQHAGRVVHVPDADVGRLQRKPHALFGGSQRFGDPIPLGDVRAGAERADDASIVIPQHGVAPLDQPLFAGSRQDGVLDDRQISAGQVVQRLVSAGAPHPIRQARLDPVAAIQLVRGPSEDRAGVAIRQRDPPLGVEREQDDLGGVQVSLGPVPLVARHRLRLLAFEDFMFELVDAADLARERHHQVLIVLGEGSSVVGDETHPAIDMGGRRDGCGQKGVDGRMPHRELESGRRAAWIVAAQRPPVGDDGSEDARGRFTGGNPVRRAVPQAASGPQVTTRCTVRSFRSRRPSVT